MPLFSYRGNSGFHEKWTNAVLRCFLRQRKWCKAPTQLTSHQARRSNKYVPKTAKIEGYNTRFRTFLGLELRTSRDTSLGHVRSLKMSHKAWNEYIDAFTFISRQFWVSREMNKCGCSEAFRGKANGPSTRTTLKVTSSLLGLFREKIKPGPEKSKCVKTAKIEGYNTHFLTFLGPELWTPQILHWDMGGHWKWVTWLGTNIWIPLRSFRSNFGFHEKWTNGGVQRLFEARQMVPNTRATLQVTLALLRMFREKIRPGPKK